MLEAYWPLTMFWEILGNVDLFWTLIACQRRSEKRCNGIGIGIGMSFLGFWDYVMVLGCHPMGLPMLRPIL
jgi:hypothetical protein